MLLLRLFLYDFECLSHSDLQRLQFWQVEYDDDPILGSLVDWGDRIRLRHMTTKRYLSATLKFVSIMDADQSNLDFTLK